VLLRGLAATDRPVFISPCSRSFVHGDRSNNHIITSPTPSSPGPCSQKQKSLPAKTRLRHFTGSFPDGRTPGQLVHVFIAIGPFFEWLTFHSGDTRQGHPPPLTPPSAALCSRRSRASASRAWGGRSTGTTTAASKSPSSSSSTPSLPCPPSCLPTGADQSYIWGGGVVVSIVGLAVCGTGGRLQASVPMPAVQQLPHTQSLLLPESSSAILCSTLHEPERQHRKATASQDSHPHCRFFLQLTPLGPMPVVKLPCGRQ